MTIDGFWKELKERYGEQDLGRHRVSLPDYATGHFCKHRRFLTVGIDIFQWISEHSSHADSRNLPDEDASIKVVISGIASKIRYLISLPLNFVIVFDGKVKMDKLRWKSEFEYNHEVIFETKYAMDLEIIKRDNHIMTGKCVIALIELLNSWNISYIHAPGDGEIELARLNQAGIIDAIITNDADAFAYGATIILRNFSRYAEDKPSAGNKKGVKTSKEFYVTPVDIALLNHIGLDTDKIMYIACCQGDDYSKGIKGMGIKKAFSLATNNKKMNDDFNPVREFKKIYVGTNLNDYIQGKIPHSYSERLKLLEKYKHDLAEHIKSNARAYFNQAHNADIILPHDAIIASHFYPHFSKYLFKFESYETNLNELSGKLQVRCCLPKLPQPLSIKQFNENEHVIYRGNDLKKSLGTTTFTKHGSIDTETISYTPYRWFDSLKYDTILAWTQTGKNSKKGMEFLADSLGACYLWRAIVNANELELQKSDFKIGKPETKEFVFEGEVHEQLCYPIKFKAREIFRRLLQLSVKATDENLNEVEEKPISKSFPADILNIDENGTRLIESYIPQTPKSKAKGRRKTPTSQRTTLDSFSGSKKSPITIHSRKASILNMSGASISSIRDKRSAYDSENDNMDISPRKKHKVTTETEIGSSGKINPVLVEPFEDDAEVSKVLKTTDYVGNSYIEVNGDNESNKPEIFDRSNLLGDLMSADLHTAANDQDHIKTDNILDDFDSENFDNFYQESTQKPINGFFDNITVDNANKNSDENGNPNKSLQEISDISDLSNVNELNNLSSIFAPRKKFQKDSRTVVRGESNLDRMTKLPTLPDEPNNTIISSDDSFSSTGTIQKLFDMEKEKEKKKKEEMLKNSKTTNKEIYSSDDTFSTTGTIEKLLHKDDANVGIKVKREDGILDQAVQNSRTGHAVNRIVVDLTMNSDDEKTEMKVDHSDIETIKSEQSTPVANRIKDIIPKQEVSAPTSTIPDDNEIPPTGIPFPTYEIINGKQYEVYDSRIPAAVVLGQPSGVYYGNNIPTGPAFNQQYQVKREDIKPTNQTLKANFDQTNTEKSDANDSCRLPPEYKGEAYLAENTDDSEMWRDPKDVEHSDSDDDLEIIAVL